MRIQEPQKALHTTSRRRIKGRTLQRRFPIRENQDAPAFLIRLVGEERARDLSDNVIIHHRHD